MTVKKTKTPAETIERYQTCVAKLLAMFNGDPFGEHPCHYTVERLEALIELGLLRPTGPYAKRGLFDGLRDAKIHPAPSVTPPVTPVVDTTPSKPDAEDEWVTVDEKFAASLHEYKPEMRGDARMAHQVALLVARGFVLQSTILQGKCQCGRDHTITPEAGYLAAVSVCRLVATAGAEQVAFMCDTSVSLGEFLDGRKKT